jgi:hypothetical protein
MWTWWRKIVLQDVMARIATDAVQRSVIGVVYAASTVFLPMHI